MRTMKLVMSTENNNIDMMLLHVQNISMVANALIEKAQSNARPSVTGTIFPSSSIFHWYDLINHDNKSSVTWGN